MILGEFVDADPERGFYDYILFNENALHDMCYHRLLFRKTPCRSEPSPLPTHILQVCNTQYLRYNLTFLFLQLKFSEVSLLFDF